MSEPPVEIILLNQVASYLAMPISVVDADGVVYYNEPAEELLGRPYEETDQMSLDVWARLWAPADSSGDPLTEELPLAIAARRRRPAQGTFSIQGSDGVLRRVVVTAIPLQSAGEHPLGAVAFFWEEPAPMP